MPSVPGETHAVREMLQNATDGAYCDSLARTMPDTSDVSVRTLLFRVLPGQRITRNIRQPESLPNRQYKVYYS